MKYNHSQDIAYQKRYIKNPLTSRKIKDYGVLWRVSFVFPRYSAGWKNSAGKVKFYLAG